MVSQQNVNTLFYKPCLAVVHADVRDMLFNEGRVKTLVAGLGRPVESGGEDLCWDNVCVALMQTESYLFSKSSSSTDNEGVGWMSISSPRESKNIN